MLTVADIMATQPCLDWPESRVKALAPRLDLSSWVTAAKTALDAGVDRRDVMLTVCRRAFAAHRQTVLVPWLRHVTFVRIDAQIDRWPDAPDDVNAVRGELLRWCAGDDTVDLRAVRDEAWAAADAAAADAAADAADAAADAAAADAADAAYDAYAAADADADAAYVDLLLDLCARLDAAEAA